MFEQFNYDYFMQSMLANVPDDLDKREGSVIWDALAPAALELDTAYMFLLDMFNKGRVFLRFYHHMIFAPHLEQNFAPAMRGAPHFEQNFGAAVRAG